jgi:hypothetical protein
LAIIIDEITDVFTDRAASPAALASTTLTSPIRAEVSDELGIWFSSLDVFLSDVFTADPTAKLQLISAVLERCIRLNAQLYAAEDDLNELARVLRDAVQMARCAELKNPSELNAWSMMLGHRLRHIAARQRLIANAEQNGEGCLPEPLRSFAIRPARSEEEAVLALVLPRFSRVLRWLSVVGAMLENDEPLKPALLIFAHVNEQLSELIAYINNRLERFPNEDAELFGALDAASYTASVGLKRVFSKEFAGIISLRATPSIYAGVESAYATLNEGLQHILGGLARIVDPSADVGSMFPNLRVNFERSLVLRQELWSLVRLTRSAEQEPTKAAIELLTRALRKFRSGTIRFLFYKDTETLERFVEEIVVMQQTKDLVPLLHRFGAYLETLFGQVSLRAVLEDHPFERR